MAHLIFDEDEQQQLRESARERAAAGEGLLAYALEQIAAEGIDLSNATPYAAVQARYGLGDADAARTPGAA
ncbi:hypothetical protein [Streptomyces lateritius]|uniref:hypothetical protein n=1 Tax=Streptomyces lateritius TaxID=67313 RepID=UPI001679A477|nr:hypothetical protein [Streptomyces lateritius]GGU11438.1 hypothetical protein GCM10010272_65840 [Streptomyces lateritius]